MGPVNFLHFTKEGEVKMLAAAKHQAGLFLYICLFGAFFLCPEIKAYYLVPINQDIQLHQPIPSDEFQYLDDSDLFQLEEELEENEENEMLYDVTEDLNIVELEDDDSSSQYGITEWYLPRRNKRSPQFGFGGGFGGGRFGGRHRRRHRHRHGGLGFGNGRGQALGALTNLAFGLALGGGRYGYGGFGNGYGYGYGNGFYGK